MDVDPAEGLRYLDHASTSFPTLPGVLEAMHDFGLRACVSPGRATYDLGLVADTMVQDCRRALARLFGAPDPDRIVFGLNATDALNLAIAGRLGGGGHVITTRLEHNSVLRPLAHLADERGVEVTLIDFGGQGLIDPDDVREALRPDTRLVILTHASNVLGTVQPVAEVGALCREAGVPLLVDAAQSAGLLSIDVQAMQIDLLAFTGHKALLGPTGVGGLVVAPGIELHHSRVGGTGADSISRRHLEGYPHRLEAGTPNLLGIAGLAAALAHLEAEGGPAARHAREQALHERLWEGLNAIEGVTLLGPDTAGSTRDRVPLLSFLLAGMDPAQVGTRLDVDHAVACRTGLHCAPLCHERLGTTPEGAVRFSLGWTTTADDLEACLQAVRELASA
ncbi:MAG: aminotransferase class V-fold PLP-dependent enzyme [Deltaproteobacteria bacterium]|nr:aminotransferase class V-fold PLP-dependent enzyme [Deltaproteobacteria bacterium]